MLSSEILPCKTSALWLDDSPKAEWLVIYASEPTDVNGKIYRDGFTVSHTLLWCVGYSNVV
jgi:hypothetical protein